MGGHHHHHHNRKEGPWRWQVCLWGVVLVGTSALVFVAKTHHDEALLLGHGHGLARKSRRPGAMGAAPLMGSSHTVRNEVVEHWAPEREVNWVRGQEREVVEDLSPHHLEHLLGHSSSHEEMDRGLEEEVVSWDKDEVFSPSLSLEEEDAKFMTYGDAKSKGEITLKENEKDLFSASWLQRRELFLDMNMSLVRTVEDGCFQAFRKADHRAKMTRDWLDFSVEHLSTWWKTAVYFKNNDKSAGERVVEILRDFSKRTLQETPYVGPLKTTICIVPFRAYSDQVLTVAALTATLAALNKHGIGRAVVVGAYLGDRDCAEQSFQILRRVAGRNLYTEFAFVRWELGVSSNRVAFNMVRGAMIGLQMAFNGELDASLTNAWLGRDHNTKKNKEWTYVYLTEPDTVFISRPQALASLTAQADRAFVIAPHRWQPVPHAADFTGINPRALAVKPLPLNFSVHDIGPENACCDDGNAHPGAPPDVPDCGDKWWRCGYSTSPKVHPRSADLVTRHARIMQYDRLRLRHGTGIVTLAANAHGRRCRPTTSSTCPPPPSS